MTCVLLIPISHRLALISHPNANVEILFSGLSIRMRLWILYLLALFLFSTEMEQKILYSVWWKSMRLCTAHIRIFKYVVYTSNTNNQCCRTTSCFAVSYSLVAKMFKVFAPVAVHKWTVGQGKTGLIKCQREILVLRCMYLVYRQGFVEFSS